MKKIIIGTPALDGKVDAWYAYSLSETIKLALSKNMIVMPIFLTNESILPMARNELLRIAHDSKCDDFVFIDADQAWDSQAFIDVIESDKQILGLPVINKSDTEINFNVTLKDIKNLEFDESKNLIKVNHIGTGFLKLTQKVIDKLWNESSDVFFRNKILKNIIEYHFEDGKFYGEDVWLCKKLQNLGYDIWINLNHNVTHIGAKIFNDNYKNYLNYIQKQ